MGSSNECHFAAPWVIDELRVLGSRCGPFPDAIALLAGGTLDVGKYVTRMFPLAEAEDAIRCAGERTTMKVLLRCSER